MYSCKIADVNGNHIKRADEKDFGENLKKIFKNNNFCP
jgi:hypothetical protein